MQNEKDELDAVMALTPAMLTQHKNPDNGTLTDRARIKKAHQQLEDARSVVAGRVEEIRSKLEHMVNNDDASELEKINVMSMTLRTIIADYLYEFQIKKSIAGFNEKYIKETKEMELESGDIRYGANRSKRIIDSSTKTEETITSMIKALETYLNNSTDFCEKVYWQVKMYADFKMKHI